MGRESSGQRKGCWEGQSGGSHWEQRKGERKGQVQRVGRGERKISYKELKLKNIDNISIVGFNNTPLSAYQNPPLATVDINAYELGYSAAKLLINNLEGNENSKKHYIVDTEFIERESFI